MSEEIEFIESETVENFQFREIGKKQIIERHTCFDYLDARWLCCSNKYGFVIVGKPNGFLYIPSAKVFQSLQKENGDFEGIIEISINATEHSGAEISKMKLSADQLTLAVAIGNEVLLYDIPTVVQNKVTICNIFLNLGLILCFM